MRAQIHRLATLVVADLAVLIACAPSPRLFGHLSAPRAWVGTAGADHAAADLAAAALWLIALWLAVGLAACALTAIPGVPGRAAGALVRTVLPGVVRRLVAGAVGAGVVLSPAVASATTAGPSGPGPAGPTQVVAAPAWPTDDPLPAPRWPAVGPRSAAPTRPSPQAPHPVTGGRTQSSHSGTSVTVRPGDTLWGIAAAHLHHDGVASTPRLVATEWPRWYAANRALIGVDADHIVPGQILHAPAEEEQS